MAHSNKAYPEWIKRLPILRQVRAVAGALRYTEYNAQGPNKVWYFPSVKLSPNGDYALKGDEWQQIPFSIEILKPTVGEAIYIDDADAANDAWGNNAVLSYSPGINEGAALNLGEPRFGYTQVLPGHPKVEVPFFDKVTTRSWIFRATFERKPHVVHSGAGFLFQNPA